MTDNMSSYIRKLTKPEIRYLVILVNKLDSISVHEGSFPFVGFDMVEEVILERINLINEGLIVSLMEKDYLYSVVKKLGLNEFLEKMKKWDSLPFI